jgi:ABC-2 type transport system ATP-binding protein
MLFELESVTKRYGPVTALSELTVSMPAGAIGLLGPNGAGKTTMIRTLLGLIRMTDGSGKILGLDVRSGSRAIREQVGFMPEDECLFPGLQGVEFVAYAGELAGLPVSDAMRRAHEMLDYVGLGEARYRKAESYSTGMKQRLKLASAIVHDPKLVILDEPTNGLDPAGREEVLELAGDLARHKGMSLLFSSHILPDVEAVCDRLMVMAKGRLIAQGTIAELKESRERVFEVRCKDTNDALAAAIRADGHRVDVDEDLLLIHLPETDGPEYLWNAARRTGQQVRHLKQRQRSLEDVFHSAVESQTLANERR